MPRKIFLPLRALETRPLVVCAVLFGVGALGAQAVSMPLWPMLALGAASLAAWLLLRPGGRRCAALLAAACLFLGAARMSAAIQARPACQTRFDVRFCGTVADSPLVDDEDSRMTCRFTDVQIEDEALGFDVRLYLRGDVRALREILPGRQICATGHLWDAEPASNPGEFDLRAYLWRNGMAGYLTAQLSDAQVTGEAAGLAAWLHALRSGIGQRIDALFPRSAELVRALVLGDRSGMDEQLREDFNRSGVAHVLAISGLHVTLVALALTRLFSLFLSKKWSFLLALAAVMFYGALVGARPSVLRAIVMYACLGCARVFGRPSDSFTRLGLAFWLLLLWNPLYLQDAGFVLSFSACGGMLCLSPPIARALRVERIPVEWSYRPRALCFRAARYFASLLCATVAAQLATLPAVIAYYGTLPLLATLANLAVVPLILLGMFLSLAALLLGAIWLPLGAAAAFAPDVILSGAANLAHLCASLPFNALALRPFPGWLAALYALVVLAASDLCRLRGRIRACLTALLVVLAGVSMLVPRASGLQIVFLDAGQADSAVILAEGNAYLVDVGLEQTPADDYLCYAAVPLRAVFLSHPHADHALGLNQVLDVCVPQRIYVPLGWYDLEADEGVAEALERAQALGAQVVQIGAGDVIELSPNVSATVLAPARESDGSNDANAHSMLLHVQYNQASALFTGDLPISAEPGPMPDVDVLKVAHHGSNAASSLMAVNSCAPSVAVISVGERNPYGHPGQQLLARLEAAGASVYRTDLCGAVSVRLFEDGSVRVHTQLLPDPAQS